MFRFVKRGSNAFVRAAALLSLAVPLLPACVAHAQVAEVQVVGIRPQAAESEDDDAVRARLFARLQAVKVTAVFEESPAREVVKRLAEISGLPIVGRYSDDALGFGLHPEAPASIAVTEESALSVLESLTEQWSALEACTWQIRRGVIEVSTKKRLAVPAARERRLYQITDMMIEAPNFDSNKDALNRGFREGLVGGDVDRSVCRAPSARMYPGATAVRVIQEVCETIEPGRWDFGQKLPEEDVMDAAPAALNRGEPSSKRGGDDERADPADQPQTQPARPRKRTMITAGMWASIRLWRDHLIVDAPDFIHRQINGYETYRGDAVDLEAPASERNAERPPAQGRSQETSR